MNIEIKGVNEQRIPGEQSNYCPEAEVQTLLQALDEFFMRDQYILERNVKLQTNEQTHYHINVVSSKTTNQQINTSQH